MCIRDRGWVWAPIETPLPGRLDASGRKRSRSPSREAMPISPVLTGAPGPHAFEDENDAVDLPKSRPSIFDESDEDDTIEDSMVANRGSLSRLWSVTSSVVGNLPVSYTHLRAHETPEHLVCRLLLEKKKCHITTSDQHYQSL
eukprot:TRINITY_DN65258_c0_g1_i1.p1 TRINITY_DN65258_c0_g1~~TRINITY_DN65258_c0_g1_i1.p1  ORF type:complete len:143 (+),score=18.98 TRINITY_DN65258_c0_g1_i1:111-539(+)